MRKAYIMGARRQIFSVATLASFPPTSEDEGNLGSPMILKSSVPIFYSQEIQRQEMCSIPNNIHSDHFLNA